MYGTLYDLYCKHTYVDVHFDGRFVAAKGWRAIEIDDLVPCFSLPFWAGPGSFLAGDKPCFSQPVEGEVWSLLMEQLSRRDGFRGKGD